MPSDNRDKQSGLGSDKDRVATYQCQNCGSEVRLRQRFPTGSCQHDCQRCGEETKHSAITDPIPVTEANPL
jgi:ribosomal protein L37AE/L43A